MMLWRRLHRKLRDGTLRHVLRRGRQPVVAAVHRERLSYLEPVALDDLHRAVREVDRVGRAGVLLEAGCGMGGSAIVLAAARTSSRPLYVYDIFGMPPPPTERDGPDAHARAAIVTGGRAEGIRGTRYYGYRSDLLEAVVANFERHRLRPADNHVHLVQGWLHDTLVVDQPVALAHIDCDRHDSVKTCLERIVPQLVPGGRLVIDDYLAWSGCRRAVDEFFARDRQAYRFTWKARLHIVRR